jgi:hypothetical protein
LSQLEELIAVTITELAGVPGITQGRVYIIEYGLGVIQSELTFS